MRSRTMALVGCAFLLVLTARADAFHFFRGNEGGGCGSGCCPATGVVTDDPRDPVTNQPIHGPLGATVLLLHNSFNDEPTLLPVVVQIQAGESIQWKWASSHCHSVTSDTAGVFDSGFVYPVTPPAGQGKVVNGFLDYPLPDPSPSLSYRHTFNTPGQYLYHCVHHQIIGMEGVVIVE